MSYLSYDWRLMRHFEAQAAAGSINHTRVLDAIVWQLHPLPRVFFSLCDRAHHTKDRLHLVEVQEVARAIHTRFLDEQVPENFHQHARDLSRAQRAKRAKMLSIFETVATSGEVERRGVDHPFVPASQEVAQLSWRRSADKLRAEPLGTAVPADAPVELNRILGPDRDWTSPTVPTLLKSCTALSWMREHDLEENRELHADAAAWSRLIVPFTMILSKAGELLLDLATSDWGANAVLLLHVELPNHFKINTSLNAVRLAHVLDPMEWVVRECNPVRLARHGLCIRVDVSMTASLNVLQYALKSGVVPPVWMAHRALVLLKLELANDESLYNLKGAELIRTLCHAAFKGFDESFVEDIINTLLKPTPVADHDDWDAEYLDFLDEMMCHDHSNAAELRDLNKANEAKRNKKLMACKQKHAEEQNEQKEAKQRKRKEKKRPRKS